jgi:hypothetical protein
VSTVCRSEEVEDPCVYTDTDLGVIDEHKNVILHLLSQLKSSSVIRSSSLQVLSSAIHSCVL